MNDRKMPKNSYCIVQRVETNNTLPSHHDLTEAIQGDLLNPNRREEKRDLTERAKLHLPETTLEHKFTNNVCLCC